MTDQRYASPEDWEQIEASGLPGTGEWGHPASITHACLLELRSRVEALEVPATRQDAQVQTYQECYSESNLVIQVCEAIDPGGRDGLFHEEARSAIRAVADALVLEPSWSGAAAWLRKEAER